MGAELSPEWRQLLSDAMVDNPNALADRIKRQGHRISPQTVYRLVYGTGDSSTRTVRLVAEALRVKPKVIDELAGRTPDGGDFALPAKAARLTPKQRQAVLAVVMAMLQPDERAGTVTSLPKHPHPSADPFEGQPLPEGLAADFQPEESGYERQTREQDEDAEQE